MKAKYIYIAIGVLVVAIVAGYFLSPKSASQPLPATATFTEADVKAKIKQLESDAITKAQITADSIRLGVSYADKARSVAIYNLERGY
jgi:hypothetical protein